MTLNTKIQKIVAHACIEAQNNKHITPIVFRQSIKLTELFEEECKKAFYEGASMMNGVARNEAEGGKS